MIPGSARLVGPWCWQHQEVVGLILLRVIHLRSWASWSLWLPFNSKYSVMPPAPPRPQPSAARWRSAGGKAGPGRKGRAPGRQSLLASRCSVPGVRCWVPGAQPGCSRSGPGRQRGWAGWGASGRDPSPGREPPLRPLPCSDRCPAPAAAFLPWARLEAPLSVNKCVCWIRRDFSREGLVVKANRAAVAVSALTASPAQVVPSRFSVCCSPSAALLASVWGHLFLGAAVQTLGLTELNTLTFPAT